MHQRFLQRQRIIPPIIQRSAVKTGDGEQQPVFMAVQCRTANRDDPQQFLFGKTVKPYVKRGQAVVDRNIAHGLERRVERALHVIAQGCKIGGKI